MSSDTVSQSEKRLWDELFGCVNYLKIPFDTVMTMPVYIRKFWILKHNEANSKRDLPDTGKPTSVDGQAINAYAQIEQGNRNVPK